MVLDFWIKALFVSYGDLLTLFTIAGDLDFSEVECVHG